MNNKANNKNHKKTIKTVIQTEPFKTKTRKWQKVR